MLFSINAVGSSRNFLLVWMAIGTLLSLVTTTTAQFDCSSCNYWCDSVLGCLNWTDDWWHLTNRPLSPTPFTRDQIGVTFTLYTRSNPTAGQMLFANSTVSVTNSNFDASKPVKFITHGYMNNGNETNFQALTAKLLTLGDYNVIRTHWPGGSITDYFHAMVNTRVVGLEIALLANTLIANFGASVADVHLIGHSLGAHISGYAGENIPNCGKITGLDPAGPFFGGMNPVVRLDPTDAQFVEAIHSNTGAMNYWGFGTVMPMGHLDFYPNGGEEQPGCSPLNNPPPDWFNNTSFFADLPACSHGRAIDLYADSLTSTCPFVAYECTDYNTFQSGGCASCGSSNLNCAQFGPLSHNYPTRSRTNVLLYFNTGNVAPYCQYHYGIRANFASSGQNLNGNISPAITGTSGSIPTSALLAATSSGYVFVPGQSRTGLITSATNVGTVSSVNLGYTYIANLFDPSTYCMWNGCNLRVSNVVVSQLSNYPESNRLANTNTACSSSSFAEIASESSATLSVASCSG